MIFFAISKNPPKTNKQQNHLFFPTHGGKIFCQIYASSFLKNLVAERAVLRGTSWLIASTHNMVVLLLLFC